MQNYPNSVGIGSINTPPTSQPARERAIVRQIDLLNGCVTSQEALLAKLNESLRPAIRPVPACAVAKDPEKLAECELASILNKLAKRVSDNNEALNFFIENLEF